MIKDLDYPSDEDVIVIDWHHSGFFDNPAASARAAFLGASSAPDTYFDGVDNIVGAGDSVATRNTYLSIINTHLAEQSKVMIYDAVYDFDVASNTCYVDFTAEMAPGESYANLARFLQCAAYEDGIIQCCEPRTGNLLWNHIGRALSTSVPITIQNSGEVQFYSSSFTLDPSWNLDNLHVAAFISRDGGRVNQSRKMVEGHGVKVDAPGGFAIGSVGTGDMASTLTYVGAITGDVIVTLDKSGLPAGWDAEIVVGATSYPTSVTFPAMAQNDTQDYTVRILSSGAPGMGSVSVTAAPAGPLGRSATNTYTAFHNTPSILFVDDDQGWTYEGEFLGAITGAGYFYNYTDDVPKTADRFAGYDIVVWTTGQNQAQTIGPTIQVELMDYLDGGGRLFVSSHGYLNHQGTGPAFTGYLGVTSFSQEAQCPSATGVTGDPIGDGLNLVMAYPFPDFADAVTGIGPNTTVWLNGINGDTGVRTDNGTYRTVFMTAAFDGVDGADEVLVMSRILDWLTPSSGPTDVTPLPAAAPVRLSLSQNAPNPFRGSTSLRFATPHDGRVQLSVYSVGGRKVADLVSGVLNAGSYSVDWDGRDSSGARVADGVYFYRLTAGGESLTKEMVHLR